MYFGFASTGLVQFTYAIYRVVVNALCTKVLNGIHFEHKNGPGPFQQ